MRLSSYDSDFSEGARLNKLRTPRTAVLLRRAAQINVGDEKNRGLLSEDVQLNVWQALTHLESLAQRDGRTTSAYRREHATLFILLGECGTVSIEATDGVRFNLRWLCEVGSVFGKANSSSRCRRSWLKMSTRYWVIWISCVELTSRYTERSLVCSSMLLDGSDISCPYSSGRIPTFGTVKASFALSLPVESVSGSVF